MNIMPDDHGKQAEERHLVGTWREFEDWIKGTIEADFRWRVRPRDTRENRKMIVGLVLGDIERNNGAFPDGNAFIERI